MFPIRDHNPSEKTPYVTYGLIAVNLLVFVSYFHLFSNERALYSFYFDWAMLPGNITDGRNLHTLVTSMFLHGGIMHLLGNMLFLWIFGDNLEEDLGHVGFLIFYLASGIAAGLCHVLAGPNSPVPTVGASGAIAGVMGGYLLLYPKAKVDVLFIFIIFFKIFPIPAWIMLGIWFGLQVFNGLATDAAAGGVAYWAHAGGFAVGLLFVIPIWLRRQRTGHPAQKMGHPAHPEAKYPFAQSRVPRIQRRK